MLVLAKTHIRKNVSARRFRFSARLISVNLFPKSIVRRNSGRRFAKGEPVFKQKPTSKYNYRRG